MKFIILRQLQHSELGMFKAYRRLGKEGSKQRAINFDWDVVDRVFPAAKDSDKIDITCRYLEASDKITEVNQWLKRQDKNWRFEGNCPDSDFYNFVEKGVLFVMSVDAERKPAHAAWVVIPLDHPAYNQILNHGECGRLVNSAMIALYDTEGEHTYQVIRTHFPDLFGEPKTKRRTLMVDDADNAPDPEGTFDILARTGHSLHSAVADLIDNSISADATEIHISFPDPNESGHWMCIRDNGKGMTPDELKRAMKIGLRKDYEANNLGKFGYGLKGASWSQADCLTVVTKAKGHEQEHRIWDKEHLIAVKRWEMPKRTIPAEFAAVTKIPETGTVILLTKIRPPVKSDAKGQLTHYQANLVKIKNHIELVFHRFLEGTATGRAKVRMWLNDVELAASNPTEHPLTKNGELKTIMLPGEENAKILIQTHIIPSAPELKDYYKDNPQDAREAESRMAANLNQNESQGIYFYRLDRLIKWGGWNGIYESIDPHVRLLRVSLLFERDVEDFLKVDISKQMVDLPPSLGQIIKDYLKTANAEARRRYAGDKDPKKPKTPTPTDTTTPKLPVTPLPPLGGGKGKQKIQHPVVRIVDGIKEPWKTVTGFTGKQVQVSNTIPALADLTKAIEGNPEAQDALSRLLADLETKGVLKHLTTAHA
jgi:hypothetical protein